jgi:predicted esterase
MEHRISFNFEGRYFTSGDKTKAAHAWVVLHGYGQLAASFLRRFRVLEQQGTFVIAPEGLSHFYLQDTESRMRTGDMKVGACWMTREDRLADIRNYLQFLNSVFDRELSGFTGPVTILGFSQGAATATRWVLDGRINFERLILWAGILPPDIDFDSGSKILHDKKTILVYGNEDPFLGDERFAEMTLLSQKLGIVPEKIEFNGGHQINEDTLLRLL